MNIFAWVGIGAFLAVIARLVLPQDEPPGVLARICLGIAGGVVGGWVAALVWGVGPSGAWAIMPSALGGAAIGAALLIGFHQAITYYRQHRKAEVHEMDHYRNAA